MRILPFLLLAARTTPRFLGLVDKQLFLRLKTTKDLFCCALLSDPTSQGWVLSELEAAQHELQGLAPAGTFAGFSHRGDRHLQHAFGLADDSPPAVLLFVKNQRVSMPPDSDWRGAEIADFIRGVLSGVLREVRSADELRLLATRRPFAIHLFETPDHRDSIRDLALSKIQTPFFFARAPEVRAELEAWTKDTIVGESLLVFRADDPLTGLEPAFSKYSGSFGDLASLQWFVDLAVGPKLVDPKDVARALLRVHRGIPLLVLIVDSSDGGTSEGAGPAFARVCSKLPRKLNCLAASLGEPDFAPLLHLLHERGVSAPMNSLFLVGWKSGVVFVDQLGTGLGEDSFAAILGQIAQIFVKRNL